MPCLFLHFKIFKKKLKLKKLKIFFKKTFSFTFKTGANGKVS
jgi:hypothetical protein